MKNNRSGNEGRKFGTASMYAASPRAWKHYDGDYQIEIGSTSHPEDMRAYRKRARKNGKACVLREEALKDEAVVIFGPDVSAGDAISLLRRLASEIARRGLYTGENWSGQQKFEKKVTQL
jgi:hypothetical protein